MSLNNEDIELLNNLIKNGKTVNDIIHAVNWVDKERERSRVKARKHHKEHYVSNGNPIGRPKKKIEPEIQKT